MRKDLGFSQRELTEKFGKPQSTIARIENGTLNVSFKVLYEIALGVGKELHLKFKSLQYNKKNDVLSMKRLVLFFYVLFLLAYSSSSSRNFRI